MFTPPADARRVIVLTAWRSAHMPDTPIEAGGERGYPDDMEARLRVLEEIAAGTKAILAEIRADQRAMRAEMVAGFTAGRAEMVAGFTAGRAEMAAGFTAGRAEMAAGFTAGRAEMAAGFTAGRAEMTALDQRRERDFRLTFGAIITATLGMAYLIARSAHWL
jgi:hypothetical protein